MPVKIVFPLLLIGLLIYACDSNEFSALKKENASLRKELEKQRAINQVITDANKILDSIDHNRKYVPTQGDKRELSDRLYDINEYVKNTEQKIAIIERQLRYARVEASAYVMMADAYKGEVGIRDGEVSKLGALVANMERENRELMDSVQLQAVELSGIEEQQKHLVELQQKVHHLEDNLKLSEAEIYYARARLVEAAANRTKFAVQKKKQTLREALELYQKAFALGKKEAQQNIRNLELIISEKQERASL